MKYNIIGIQIALLILIASPFSFTNYKQETEWTLQKSGVFSRLNSVYFIDKNNGWAAGANGALLVTKDGGNKWVREKLTGDFLKENIRDIQLWNSEGAGILLGEHQTVGARGFSNQAEKAFMVSRECYADPWVTSNIILEQKKKSQKIEPKIENEDPAAKNKTPVPVLTTLLVKFYFSNDEIGWACGEVGTILKTVNSGREWKKLEPITEKLLYDVTSFNKNVYSIGAAGTIIKSENVGRSWTVLSSGTTETLRSVHFTSELQGWIVGTNGIVLKTADGGKSWQKLPPPTTETLLSCWFFNDKEGWVAGFSGKLMKTIDGGATWNDFTVNSHADLTKLFFIDQNTGWVVGANGVIYKYGE